MTPKEGFRHRFKVAVEDAHERGLIDRPTVGAVARKLVQVNPQLNERHQARLIRKWLSHIDPTFPSQTKRSALEVVLGQPPDFFSPRIAPGEQTAHIASLEHALMLALRKKQVWDWTIGEPVAEKPRTGCRYCGEPTNTELCAKCEAEEPAYEAWLKTQELA